MQINANVAICHAFILIEYSLNTCKNNFTGLNASIDNTIIANNKPNTVLVNAIFDIFLSTPLTFLYNVTFI